MRPDEYNKLSNQNQKTSNLTDQLHRMIADHNSSAGKRFYYSEEEMERLCRHASKINLPADPFDIWWDSIKKK